MTPTSSQPAPHTVTQTDQRPTLWLMVGASILCTLVTVVFARLAYGLILPSMSASLGLNYAEAANLGTVTALGYLTLVLPAGMLASRYGARRAILLGLCLGIAGFSGLAMASSYPTLLVLMVMLGAATAFAYTPLISLLGSWFPERRGTVIGFANSGVGSGMLLAGAVVPLLTGEGSDPDTGWRFVWALFGLSAVLCAVVCAIVFKDPPRPAQNDSVGKVPRVRINSVYRNPHVVTVGLVYAVVGVTYIVQSIFMYSFALNAGISPVAAGRLVALMGILAIFAGPLWGWGSDLMGHGRALMICMCMCLIGTAAPVLRPTLPAFTLHYLLLGISVTGLFTAILASATRTVSREHAAVAVSFVTLFFAFGQLVGPALAGLLLEATGNFRLTFLISCLLMVLGIYLSWLSGQSQDRTDLMRKT
ncbi:MAG: MFS transporter [Gammaproteobacteria bacterium]|nr:MFS transporter [Gammaproteobacteria bacterium]MDP2139362.1 MFS transporter [Gammaproteobacteria bacterium]MDP2347277.1 MFS transporter [Gammaproteobacteria bacterium]